VARGARAGAGVSAPPPRLTGVPGAPRAPRWAHALGGAEAL